MSSNAGTLLCGPRDAAWHDRPNVRHPARWHVTSDGDYPLCGQRCFIVDPLPLETAPASRRCNRHGCREAWSQFDAQRQAGESAS